MATAPNLIVTPTYIYLKKSSLAYPYDQRGITEPGIDLASWITSTIASGTIIAVDIITDHYTDIDSETYYYYGYNRNGEWEILRTLRIDINTEELATEINNPTITTLNDAITNRVTLTYA